MRSLMICHQLTPRAELGKAGYQARHPMHLDPMTHVCVTCIARTAQAGATLSYPTIPSRRPTHCLSHHSPAWYALFRPFQLALVWLHTSTAGCTYQQWLHTCSDQSAPGQATVQAGAPLWCWRAPRRQHLPPKQHDLRRTRHLYEQKGSTA